MSANCHQVYLPSKNCIGLLFLIFFSLYGPQLVGIRFSYFVFILCLVWQISESILSLKYSVKVNNVPLYVFIVSIMLFSLATFIESRVVHGAFLGGLESYLEIVTGFFIGSNGH